MTTTQPKKTRSFYAWGNLEDAPTEGERAAIDRYAHKVFDGKAGAPVALPKVEEYPLAAPRFGKPEGLADFLTDAPEERLRHSRGRSYPDLVRMLLRDSEGAPDYVAYPSDEAQIARLLEWAGQNQVAVVPYGGGSSVCGGVDTGVGDGHAGVISLDMERFSQILEIDKTSRAARIQAGMLGPDLETALRSHDLTLRHFPQSFEFSTLGGWIATRAGGHYASLYTHIDDFVESVRMVTPSGEWESRRLPASGAGPSPDRMAIGSEGIFGLITEAWVRLQDRPTFRGSASVSFPSMERAGQCVRALTQSALFPTNCRVLDPNEARSNRAGDGTHAVLILGFESADHPVDAWLRRALEVVDDHGGTYDTDAVERSLTGESAEHREGAAGAWRSSFIRAPYLRDYMIQKGIVTDTFETSITWDRFDDFYNDVGQQAKEAIVSVTGVEPRISCRLTHVYPDGAAPYFTFTFPGTQTGDLQSCLSQWREIKQALNEIVVGNGGTVTHHHAVGRDHRSGYDRQTPDLFRETLRAMKQRIDPHNTLNPGVLIDA